MKKIELEIIALSHSLAQTQSYSVVLGEVNGLRRLPIQIGGFEAQAIAVAIEHMNPSRPLTHDLMKNFMMAFNVGLHEIVINDFQEGVFYARLICGTESDTVEIDSRTSDAIALAVRFGCKIYTYENILAQTGVMMDDDLNPREQQRMNKPTSDVFSDGSENLKNMRLEDLNNLLQEVLENEDYIRAIAIRDEIKSRGGN